MAQLKKKYFLVTIGVLFLGVAVFTNRDEQPLDLHSHIQQHVLEAEYGSATTFHFASQPGIVSTSTESSTSLVGKLQANQADVRWFAAGELAKRKDKRAVEYIIKAMRDPTDTIRVCVMAQALGRIKDPRALGPLSAAAFDSTNRDLRLCAIQSLGMLGDPRAVPKLIEALETRNMTIAAASAL
ncbi:MAG: HEAT repeat domain-containing protein, partial [Gammaproteobacteria bacterium]